jgi:hypothetical protein
MLIFPDTFTDDARTVLSHSGQHAQRLGHTQRGGEHYLLALTAADIPVAQVLRDHGVTPDDRSMTPLCPPPPAPPGRYQYQAAATAPAGRIPPTADAWDAVGQSTHEAMIRHDRRICAEHLALAFTAMTTGLVPRILPALGTSAPALRAAILTSSWRAG